MYTFRQLVTKSATHATSELYKMWLTLKADKAQLIQSAYMMLSFCGKPNKMRIGKFAYSEILLSSVNTDLSGPKNKK